MKINTEYLVEIDRHKFRFGCQNYGDIGSFILAKGTIHHLVGSPYLLFHDERTDEFSWGKCTDFELDKEGKLVERSVLFYNYPVSPPDSDFLLPLIEQDRGTLEFFMFNMDLLNET